MIRQLFSCPKTIIRLETGPLAEHVYAFAEYLSARRHTNRTICTYLTLCDLFGRWLVRNNLQLRDISEAVIDRFANSPSEIVGSRRKNWRWAALSGGRALFRYLRSIEVITEATSTGEADNDVQRYSCAYDRHLDKVQGLAKETRELYLHYTERFLISQMQNGRIDWQRVTANEIGTFVTEHARQRPGCTQQLVTALRSFLRYLVATNLLPAGIDTAIPISKRYIHTKLPDRLTEDELGRLLVEARKDSTAYGVRNYTIILLLTRLALRAKEVIDLTLDDIDWVKGVLYIRSRKGRERALPLPKDVAECLLRYLKDCRPKTNHREIFVTHNAPYRRMDRSAVVSAVVRKLFSKADITRPVGKAHLLRHTIATQMINSGASFKDTADFLGHRFLQTTAIYAKLDLDSLSEISLPWPGGAR